MVVFQLSISGSFSNLLLPVGFIIIFFLIVWLFSKSRGRIAEEQQEELDTAALRNDEKKAEKAEKDEKKQCRKLMEDINFIDQALPKIKGGGEIRDNIRGQLAGSRVAVRNLMEERMSEERAVEMFQRLHKSLSEVIGAVEDIKELKFIVRNIVKHQGNFYKDLVKEINATRDEKKRVLNIWREIRQKQQGSDSQQAA